MRAVQIKQEEQRVIMQNQMFNQEKVEQGKLNYTHKFDFKSRIL